MALALTRQALPTLDRTKYAPPPDWPKALTSWPTPTAASREVILIGTGSEVYLCVEAYEQLKKDGIQARVVSMPSWELFERQSKEYREQVLPAAVTARVAVEQGVGHGLGTICRHDRRGDRHEKLRRLGAVCNICRRSSALPWRTLSPRLKRRLRKR